MRTILSVLSVVLVTLAGCADTVPTDTPDDDEAKFDEIDVGDDVGAIRGLVLDPSITPIEGATVAIKSLGLEATSNEDGAFVFTDLEPGTYFLAISKVGYAPAQTSTVVEAGIDTPPIVKVQLQHDIENLPFTEVTQFTGYLQCGAGIPGVGSLNPCAVLDSVNTFDVFVQRPVTAAQSEMFWEGTNLLGDGLDIGHLRPGTLSNYAGSDGPSPRVLLVNGTEIEDENGDGYESFLLRVFPGTNSPSLVLEQGFEIIHTNFYGFNPQDGWTFLEQGPHPVPA